MYEVIFFSAGETYSITVRDLSNVMIIVSSGANVMIRNMKNNNWCDACGGKIVSTWAKPDGFAAIIA